MVNLPVVSDQPSRNVGERGSDRRHRERHRTWGARFGRWREEMRLNPETMTLIDLEEQAARAVYLMEKHTKPDSNNFKKAMELLRLQYNLNFMIKCDKCHSLHDDHDEIIAPER